MSSTSLANLARPTPEFPAEPLILELSGISKRFASVAALSDVSLTVRPREVHCLLGENGAGKSTLCNVIFGVYQPDTGDVRLDGRPFRPSGPAESLGAGVAMVHQHFSIISNMTVVENLMMGQAHGRLKRPEFAERIRKMSAAYDLAVDPDKLVGELSVGERQRVEIVKCLMREPRLLVLDEPTAVLPPLEIDALLAVCRRVADAGCGVLLVTHKLAEIARVADRVTVLRAGRVVESSNMADADMRQLVRSMIGRDVGAIDTIVAASLGATEAAETTETPIARKALAGENALTIDGISYCDSAGVQRLDEITLEVGRGEIVGLAGVEGNGQSELGAILAGMLTATSGRMFVDGRELTRARPTALAKAGVGIIPEDRHAVGCILGMSVAENMFLNDIGRFSMFGLTRTSAMTKAAAKLMQNYDVRAASPTAPMASLSGGNQQKAILARELSLDPLVFLLASQPTRGLDVGAVSAVYEKMRAARDAGVGVLLISSELDELIAVADRILVMYRGRIVGTRPAHSSAREAIGLLMAGSLHEGKPS
jgi:ABC-type uncharacterized transport system ATPase subunit